MIVERELLEALLVHTEKEGWEDFSTITSFKLQNGTYKFSKIDALSVLLDVLEESKSSDRLLVIVSVAYLEDQIRLLLEKFLADDDISRNLLDPVSSELAAFVPMANLAFSLGLIEKDWLEILKRIAQLRNKFAHIPSARSFDELVQQDSKNAGLMDSLKHRYKQFFKETSQEIGDFREVYQLLFPLMYQHLQFAIDHRVQTREARYENQIQQIMVFSGYDRLTIQKLLVEG
jgi:hypothetical protein